jgi:hypothetical protein
VGEKKLSDGSSGTPVTDGSFPTPVTDGSFATPVTIVSKRTTAIAAACCLLTLNENVSLTESDFSKSNFYILLTGSNSVVTELTMSCPRK